MKTNADVSRADQVRKRRRTQTEKRLSESATLASRPYAPIVSRTEPLSMGGQPPQRMRPKKRYQAELSMPGIEVTMPTISFSAPDAKWRLMSFALAILFAAGLYCMWTLPAFQAGTPQVAGNQRVAADEIAASMGVIGRPIVSLEPGALEKQLRLSYPEISAAHVWVGLPGVVGVQVTERTPSLLWQQGDGYTWIDDSGVAFRPRGTVDGLITVQAQNTPPAGVTANADPLSPAAFVSLDLVRAIRDIARQAPQGVPILYDSKYGLGWSDARGWQVYFGSDATNMPLRLQVYGSLVNMLDAKGITPALIDVQYPNAPYYRMNQ